MEPRLPAPPGPPAPDWYKDAIIYEAAREVVLRQRRTTVSATSRGLTSKLDYVQALGVDCLWLLPIYPSPLKDDGYDIADYCSVHPSYGTIDDFRAFRRRGAQPAASA
jgi:maltose alpha-D-glucosyltransferase / alpha-amylase